MPQTRPTSDVRRSTGLVLAALAGLSLLLAACGDTSDSSSPHNTMGSDGVGGGMGHGESSPVAEGARRIEVTADSFAFDPPEITVKAGEDIAIALTSTDLLHDLVIDELDAHVAADKGKTAEGGFTAGEPGRYSFYCSVLGHRSEGMEGTLIVEAA